MTRLIVGAAASALLLLSVPAQAIPTYDNFGPLPEATFDGSGIPNDAVAITTIEAGGGTITLGLTAHQRFTGPALSSDEGIFQAPAGVAEPAGASTPGALWNFAFFIGASENVVLGEFQIDLLYDFNPGANTPESEFGVIDITAGLFASQALSMAGLTIEGSENLSFAYLTDGIAGFVTAPTYLPFNPFVGGEYSFVLTVGTEAELGRAAINVVVSAVPVPAAAPLLALGLGALALVRRRRRA